MILRPIQPIPATRPVMVAASRRYLTSLLSDMVCLYIGFIFKIRLVQSCLRSLFAWPPVAAAAAPCQSSFPMAP